MRKDEYLVLLRAVLLDPADDLARLTYADWLDDRGGPGDAGRAEFVRVQCELARSWPTHSDLSHQGTSLCPGCTLRRQDRDLFMAHGRDWFGFPADGHLAAITDTRWVGVEQSWFVRRGFVAEVRLPLAVLFGGPCGRCGGSGLSEREYHGATDDDGGCPDCSGTGTTPGVAADLFARQPVTRVVLTDVSATYFTPTIYEPEVYGWYDRGRSDYTGFLPESDLPTHLYRLLPPGMPDYHRMYSAHFYPTAAAARDALSAACVSWGRSLAGLTAPVPAG